MVKGRDANSLSPVATMATELLALCSTPFRDSMTGFDALVFLK